MTNRTIQLDDRIYEYLTKATLREPEVFKQLREETAKLPVSNMQIAPEQGQFMALLAELIGTRKAIEIGTFTGYSALWVASILPEEGRLVACDISEEWTSIAKRFWEKVGVSHKIDLRLGPAQDTINKMLEQPDEVESYDFAFIDADKTGYDDYYERVLKLIRPGGLITFDNVLRHGKIADKSDQSEGSIAIRALNLKIRDDERVSSSLVPIGDGLLLARKR